ncbi:hypothetical protein FNV43_RR03923 [Rhamnella rubrinervis]|uniref:Uncharacterized protein n=1 Tax=Rhamnella rubrinervis TaxID=2594499 RepID=A0A8K0HK20_9ROSA|nr:hypothetical protein FNV43_RR03923 [Rhamnella rubrinervis]
MKQTKQEVFKKVQSNLIDKKVILHMEEDHLLPKEILEILFRKSCSFEDVSLCIFYVHSSSFIYAANKDVEFEFFTKKLEEEEAGFDFERLSFMGPISPHYASDMRIDDMVNFASDDKFIELNLDGNIDIHIVHCCRLSGTIFLLKLNTLNSLLPFVWHHLSAQAEHTKFLKLRGFRLDCDED